MSLRAGAPASRVQDWYLAADRWAAGADPAYERLSAAVVAASPAGLGGRVVLDLGAGTGATSRAIAAAGGRPLGLDASHAMLAFRQADRPPSTVADMTRLPLAEGAVDAAVAAFSLSHVADPTLALAEANRVTGRGGPVLVGVFATTGARHVAAAAVDEVARAAGWTPPAWYVRLKSDLEPLLAAPDALRSCARSAGLASAVVTDVEVDAGLDTPASLVDWRLAGPGLAPFVAALPAHEAVALRTRAIRSLGQGTPPLRPLVRILSSVAAATR